MTGALRGGGGETNFPTPKKVAKAKKGRGEFSGFSSVCGGVRVRKKNALLARLSVRGQNCGVEPTASRRNTSVGATTSLGTQTFSERLPLCFHYGVTLLFALLFRA